MMNNELQRRHYIRQREVMKKPDGRDE